MREEPQTALSDTDLRRILLWAAGCDGESYLGGQDWLLIVRLSEVVGINPRSVAPNYAQDLGVDPSPWDRPEFRDLESKDGGDSAP